MMEGRDSRGHFAKGNVPWNKGLNSPRVITFTCKFCLKSKPLDEMKVAMRFFPPLPCCSDCCKSLERPISGGESSQGNSRYPQGSTGEARGEQMTLCVCARCKKPWGALGSPARCPHCGQASFATAVLMGSQAMSAALKRRWQEDPEYRAKQSAAIKKLWQNPEYRAKQSVAQSVAIKKLWQNPEYRAKQSAAIKKRWQDPEYRARRSARRRVSDAVK